MKKAKILAVLLCVLSVPSAGFAQSAWVSEPSYNEKMSGKLEFGLRNTLLGWTDLFYEPNRYQQDERNVWAGVGKGLVDTVHNTVGGAIQVATFPIPVDFPLPEGGVDLSGIEGDKAPESAGSQPVEG